jgi:hypothetical protein
MSDHAQWQVLLDDDAPEAEREASLRHLSGCAGCRARLAATDPSRLFALLALEPVPAALLARLSDDVASSIAAVVPAGANRGFRRGWGAVAASLLLAGVFSTYLWNRDGGTADPEALPSQALAQDQGRESEFELLSSPGTAQVVDLSVGGTRFVMIFDEDLDL